tara:strand:+ start:5518 stop:6753 length:1236 start_codon:yes stop_codon:yes gene_type:complete
MSNKEIIVGLDVGTTKVCTIIGQRNLNNEVEIIGVGTNLSDGLKKGSVVNIDKTIKSIQTSVDEAKLMAGVEIDNASIGIAGSHIYSFDSTGVVAVRGKEITEDDIERVIEAAKAVVIPSDREILHVIPQEYTIDNAKGIKNPVGMCGVRLEAKVHVVTGAVSLIQNLVNCVEKAGVKSNRIVLQPLASSEAVISPEEKEMGIVLVDIGGGTTDVAIWKENSLVHTQIIPVGGNHFTNDLAVGLKVPHSEAEKIKVEYGSVLRSQLVEDELITLDGISGSTPREISKKVITEILSARAEELYYLVSQIVKEQEIDSDINGGFIITGGGSLVCDMTTLGEYILQAPCRVGYPIPFGGMTNVMQSPKYSTVLGLLKEAIKDKEPVEQELFKSTPTDLISRFSASIKSVFKELF